jgi:hypothetical protein
MMAEFESLLLSASLRMAWVTAWPSGKTIHDPFAGLVLESTAIANKQPGRTKR